MCVRVSVSSFTISIIFTGKIKTNKGKHPRVPGSVGSYFESTSWVKNNSKGQSTEYSRAIPSQPSRDISEEAFDKAELEFPSA